MSLSDSGYSVTAEQIQDPTSPAVMAAPLLTGEDQEIVDRIKWPGRLNLIGWRNAEKAFEFVSGCFAVQTV